MIFHNLTFIIFLLVSLLVFIGLALLVRQIKREGRLAKNKLLTLSVILFIPALIVFGLTYSSLSTWKENIQYEQKREIERKKVLAQKVFVEGIYPPLAEAQEDLVTAYTDMQVSLKKTEKLQYQYPNHAELIKSIRKKWKESQKKLRNAHLDVGKVIRFSWIAHDNLDQKDVVSKFKKVSVKLRKRIKKAVDKFHLAVESAQGDLVRDIDQARHLLSSYRIKPRSKKRRKANFALRKKIQPFSNGAFTQALNYLNSINKKLPIEVKNLQKLIGDSGQQSAILEEHLLKNQDLEKPLSIIINQWDKLAKESQEQLNVIIYSLEAEYLAVEKLGLPVKNPVVNAMHKSLQRNIPTIVAKALKQKEKIKKSYKINQNFH